MRNPALGGHFEFYEARIRKKIQYLQSTLNCLSFEYNKAILQKDLKIKENVWLMAKNNLALGPGLRDPAPNYSWPWALNHKPRGMSHESLTINDRLSNELSDY